MEERKAETCGFARGIEIFLYKRKSDYGSIEDVPLKRTVQGLRELPMAQEDTLLRQGTAEKQLVDVIYGFMAAREIGSDAYMVAEGESVLALDGLPGFCRECPEERECYVPLGEKRIKVDPLNADVTGTIERYGLGWSDEKK